MTDHGLTDAEVEERWRNGDLRYKLDSAQQIIYDHWYDLPAHILIAVSLISRRWGKTYTYSCIAIEKALKKPGSIQHYFAMTTKQVRDMLIPIFQEIFEDCPEDIRPKLLQRDNAWVFPEDEETGRQSKVLMFGADDQRACNRARGQFSDNAFVDEAGYIEVLGYLTRSVLTPMLHGREGARITMYSNAPYSPSHDITGFIEVAKAQGSYLHRTIYDSPRFSEQYIEMFAEEAGGRDTAVWQREYMALIVVDENSAVIPEWTSRAHHVWVLDPEGFRALEVGPEHEECDIRLPLVREVEWPEYFDIYTVIDLGFAPDLTSIITGFWDMNEATLVFEDEEELSRATTDLIAEAVVDVEKRRWSDYWEKQTRVLGRPAKPYLRVMDVNRQMQADLATLHQLEFMLAYNKDLDAQVNRFRQRVRHGKVAVNPRCKRVISHFGAAYWDTRRKSFARPHKKPRPNEPYYGHFDHVSSAILFNAHVVENHDPFPMMPTGVNARTHHISQKAIDRRRAAKRSHDGIAQLARVMGGRRRKVWR